MGISILCALRRAHADDRDVLSDDRDVLSDARTDARADAHADDRADACAVAVAADLAPPTPAPTRAPTPGQCREQKDGGLTQVAGINNLFGRPASVFLNSH